MRYADLSNGWRVFLAACLVTLAVCCAGSAQAAVCTVVVSDLGFGAVDTLGGASMATADVKIGCDNVGVGVTAITVCGDLGDGTGGSAAGERLLTSGTATLRYQLYKDSGHSISWGSNAMPTLGTVNRFELPVSDNTASQEATLYGQTVGRQFSVTAGTYVSTFAGANASFAYAEGSLSCAAMTGSTTADASFTVSARVASNCLIETDDVDFGQHGSVDNEITAVGGLDITCTPGAAYSITVSGGETNVVDPEARIMRSGPNTIVYGLYSDSGHSIPWGATAGTQVSGTGAGEVSIPVYGRVLPQDVVPGAYRDTVLVTITYQ